MAKVYKFSGDPNKIEAGSNFIDYASINSLPALEKVKCVTVDTEWVSKDGNSGWHIVVELMKKAPKDKKGRTQQYSQLHRYIMLDSEWVEQRIAELCDAFLGNRPKQVNAVKFVGKTAAVKLRGELFEGEERAKIQRFLEADEAEEDEDDESDEEEEDEDAEEEDEDEDEDEDEAEDYNDYSLPQLRAELKRRELDSKGKKDDLVERLEADDEEGDEEEDEDEEEEDDYSEYSTQELKEEAKRRGLRVLKRHTDEDLIGMLEEDDENEEDPLDEDEE